MADHWSVDYSSQFLNHSATSDGFAKTGVGDSSRGEIMCIEIKPKQETGLKDCSFTDDILKCLQTDSTEDEDGGEGGEDEQEDMEEDNAQHSLIDSISGEYTRKSQRERRERQVFSPIPESKGRKRKARSGERGSVATVPGARPADKLPDGTPFCCDRCKSPYIMKSRRKVCKSRQAKQSPPLARHKTDPNTGLTLTLCNACGLAFDRPVKQKTEKLDDTDAKELYLQEATEFARQLAETLNDSDADRLACPYFKNRPCGCLQRYIMANGDEMESQRRAGHLLSLLKMAKQLSKEKCYDVKELSLNAKNKKSLRVGIGNGHKHSKAFEDYVMVNRRFLREEIKLCERATQRVLMYSNNFMHKKLKTEDDLYRAARVKGKAALGQLTPIRDLIKLKCCVDNCVRMVLSHSKLLDHWRERASQGQTEARRVLAEMLTPSGGSRPNCQRFITAVTGCSGSTITLVNKQMKHTGGVREPPEHGLKKFYREKQTKKHSEEPIQQKEAMQESNLVAPFPVMVQQLLTEDGSLLVSQPLVAVSQVNASSPPKDAQQHSLTDALQSHRQQILTLQKQLSQQQVQLQQQQQLLQQQLLHQVLLESQASNNASVQVQAVTLQSLQQLLALQQQYQQLQQQQINQLQQPLLATAIGGDTVQDADTVTTSAAESTLTSEVLSVSVSAPSSGSSALTSPVTSDSIPHILTVSSPLPESSQPTTIMSTAKDGSQICVSPSDVALSTATHHFIPLSLVYQPVGNKEGPPPPQLVLTTCKSGDVPPDKDAKATTQVASTSDSGPTDEVTLTINTEDSGGKVSQTTASETGTGVEQTLSSIRLLSPTNIAATASSLLGYQVLPTVTLNPVITSVSPGSQAHHTPAKDTMATSSTQTMVRQILDITGQPIGAMNLTQSQASNLLSQLSETTVAPNVNISLVQEPGDGGENSGASSSQESQETQTIEASTSTSTVGDQTVNHLLTTSPFKYFLTMESSHGSGTIPPSTPSVLATSPEIESPPDMITFTPTETPSGEASEENSRNESPNFTIDVIQLLNSQTS